MDGIAAAWREKRQLSRRARRRFRFFAAPPILKSLGSGADILLLAQKSGIVYALMGRHSRPTLRLLSAIGLRFLQPLSRWWVIRPRPSHPKKPGSRVRRNPPVPGSSAAVLRRWRLQPQFPGSSSRARLMAICARMTLATAACFGISILLKSFTLPTVSRRTVVR